MACLLFTARADVKPASVAYRGTAPALNETPFAILAGMMLLSIFVGMFVDQVSMMLITLPVFMPIVQRLGIDLIWFSACCLATAVASFRKWTSDPTGPASAT